MTTQQWIFHVFEYLLPLAIIGCLVSGGIKGMLHMKNGLFHPLFFLSQLFLGFMMIINLQKAVTTDPLLFYLSLLGLPCVIITIGCSYFRAWRKASGSDAKI